MFFSYANFHHSQDFFLFLFLFFFQYFINKFKELHTVINACVASGGWVPMGQGAATAIHPKAEEHPQAYQPATQPRAPPAPSPLL